MRKKRLVKPYKSSRSKRKTKVNPKQEIFYLLSCVAIVLSLFLTGVNFSKILAKPKPTPNVLAESRNIYHERDFWQQILSETPNYLPGILELAKIENELGNSQASAELLAKAKLINPNDERVKETISSFLRTSPFVQ